MHLCCHLFGIFQRGLTSNLDGLHTILSHGFCNEFTAGNRGVFLLRTLDNGVGSALVEECNGISIMIVRSYPCSIRVGIAQEEE